MYKNNLSYSKGKGQLKVEAFLSQTSPVAHTHTWVLMQYTRFPTVACE